MTQSEFALAIGRSYPTVQHYEAGKKPTPEVVQRMRTLALENNLGSIAEALSRIDDEGAAVPADREGWHAMLDEILDSGDPHAIGAVQSNLHVFTRYVRLSPKVRGVPKRK
jgi:hypothetical protein